MANLFGKGKYADMEKENKRLKEELPKQKAGSCLYKRELSENPASSGVKCS